MLFWACQKVPITGRKQVHVYPESDMIAMSVSAYKKALQEGKVISGTPEANMVNTVGMKISAAAVKLMNKQGQSDRLKGYAWEYHLLESKEANAWCLPGGKIAVYSGILPITQTEAGLAVVMGHEVGHAIAQHGNERMTQQVAAQLGEIGLSLAIADQPAQTQNIFLNAYGLGATYGALLPFSRTQELEADKIGMVLMAIAGYNPDEAVSLWQRMKQQTQENDIAEFMSTHPSDQHRIDEIRAFLPEAKKYYLK